MTAWILLYISDYIMTITCAIVGVGATRRLSAVRWGVTRRILWAWILTIPGAALIGAALYHGVRALLS